MNYSIIISLCSVAIAACAFVLAWLSYRLNRKLPNENKLYEEKFRSYRSLMAAMTNGAGVHLQCAYQFEGNDLSGAELEDFEHDMNEELNKSYFLMEDTLNEQMLVIPDEVLEPIDKYLDLFNQADFLGETVAAGKTAKFEERVNTHFDAVVDAMRHDLSLEKLDAGLQHRIGAQRKVRRLGTNTDLIA
jgi:hypothetical protein